MSVKHRNSQREHKNPMLRKRFLVEGLGSVKKFHSLTKDSSERESRDKREDTEVGFDKGTVCPGK